MHVMLQDANERNGRWMPGAGAEAMLLLCGDKIWKNRNGENDLVNELVDGTMQCVCMVSGGMRGTPNQHIVW